uniref:Protein FAR1-RELATED SEQUENCE n=1 Tax=Arundo donax TaxID=35708 RepID=A0A0A9FGE1_ARUDO
MRRSSFRNTEYIFEPIPEMVFDSREEAFEFYNMYSWEVGFGVKFNRRRLTKDKKYRSMQEKYRLGEYGSKSGISLDCSLDYNMYFPSLVSAFNMVCYVRINYIARSGTNLKH